MTTEQRNKTVDRVLKVVDERIALVRWFRQNACASRNMPYEDNSEIKLAVEITGNTEPKAATAPSPAATAVEAIAGKIGQEAKPKLPGWLKTAVTLAAASGLGAGGAGLVAVLNGGSGTESPPAAESPAEPKTGSLLQYLQDTGNHLPPN